MAYYIGTNLVITNNGDFVPAKYSTRAALPTGASAYMAYVSDSNDIVGHRGAENAAAANGPDEGTPWYKFVTKPMSYKNEVILEQGTVGGGYISTSVWNTISHINSTTDVLQEVRPTMTFATKYGGWHSSYLYAYYHQGDSGSGTNKMDWATFTVTSINSRPTASNSPNSVNPGPKSLNTQGLILSGTDGNQLNFSTDTWASAYGCPVSQGFGAGAFGVSYGYTYTYGSNVQKMDWSSMTWSATSSGNAYGITTSYGKALNTKWNWWYYAGDVSGGSGFSRYRNTVDAWVNYGNQAYAKQSEQSGIMAQEHGYYVAGYNVSAQNNVSQKVLYATSIIILSPSTNGQRAISSGLGCYGPIP